MVSLIFYSPLPKCIQPAPQIAGASGVLATQYERIYDRLRSIVDQAKFPVINKSSGNTGGIVVGPLLVRPASIQLNDTTARFGTPDRIDYTRCGPLRGRTGWSWTLHLEFASWVTTEHLDRLLLEQGSVYVPEDSENGLEALNLLVSSRQVDHPKPHEADMGTTATYTLDAQDPG